MDINEFVSRSEYSSILKSERHNSNVDTIKTKEFYTIVPAWIQTLGHEVKIRDFLDVDGTFAVVLPNYQTVYNTLNVFLDTQDILKVSLYRGVKQIGLVKLDKFEGFWILVDG
jgi:hypothetical protein